MKTCIDFYDDTAQSWADRWYNDDLNIPYLKRFLEIINVKYPRVLDLCCGAGYESMRLKNLGATVVGADLSVKSIEIAKQKNPEIVFHVKDMLKSYTDLGIFDGVACIAGIVHLENDKLKTALKNMHEVLKDDGYLFLVFKSNGENRYSATYNQQEYARNFIFHTKEELDKCSSKLFSFVEDLGSQDDWQYLVYKKI